MDITGPGTIAVSAVPGPGNTVFQELSGGVDDGEAFATPKIPLPQ